METAIIYYTFGGSTKKEAERIGDELGVPVYSVKDKRKWSLFSSFLPGVLWSMKRKASDIAPINGLDKYDRFIIGCPIWASHPAPAFNAIVNMLPAGKEVELFFCSAGGDSSGSAEGTKKLIEEHGCTVVSYRDIRTDVAPKKLKE